MSIPKIIHLCWFGRGDYPPLAEMCIKSWGQFLSDYQIMIWNEDSFDINECSYTKKAYDERRWAFVSDYVRLKALYQYGGVYMDTDLEVIKDFSPLLEQKQFVSSYIEGGLITAGFIACEAYHPFIKKILDYYDEESLELENEQKINFIMNPLIFTKIAIENYDFKLTDNCLLKDEITIYPLDFFMPYKKIGFGKSFAHWKYRITKNTCTIHHDMSSWHKSRTIKKLVAATVRFIMPQKKYIRMKVKKNLKHMENM